MSFFDFYSRFFKDRPRSGESPRAPEDDENQSLNNPNGSFWKFGGENGMRDSDLTFDFEIITDPIEMDNYFQQTFNELMKVFTIPKGFPGLQGLDIFESPKVPAIEEKKDPREHYLKPSQPNKDPDTMLGPITSWLPPSPDTSTQPRVFSSFKSIVRKTVTLPDGTVKTEEIVRDSNGNEQRTESQTLPDGSKPPFYNPPDISDFFSDSKEPEKIPKRHFLKPGYEKLSPNEEKVDRDIDNEILQSGVKSLPPFTKDQMTNEPTLGSGIRSFTRKTVTLPNGIVESEEVVRNADGTELRTVTKTLPDGTITSKLPGLQEDNLPKVVMKGVQDLIDSLFTK